MNVIPLSCPAPVAPAARRCEQCYGEGFVLMLGQEEDCPLCHGAGWFRPARGRGAPDVVDALAMWSAWHLDTPPCDATGVFMIDLRLADAFRMLLFLGERRRQRAFLEREVFATSAGFRKADDYTATLMWWWLRLYEEASAG